MTYTKAEKFSIAQQDVAKLAKVLSHPARVAILQHLAQTKTCISGDIANELPLSRTTVSQHLQELKNAGLIKGEIDGLTVCYCIDHIEFAKAKQLIEQFFGNITDWCSDSCCS